MKKLLLTGLAVVAFAGVANAQDNVCVRPYVSLKGNYSRLNMDGKIADATGSYKTAKKDWVWGGSGAVGVKVCAFRAELEYNQSKTAKDGHTWNTSPATDGVAKQKDRSLMLNGYFDIPTHTALRPYIGAGIGVARIRNSLAWDVDNVKFRETNFAWQVGAGISYDLTCNWALDVGYRYVDNGKSKKNITLAPAPGAAAGSAGSVKFSSKEHQMTAGVRYTF